MSEYVLAGLLVLANGFWAYVCFSLVNRLMSRNFYEYKATAAPPKARPQAIELPERDEFAEAQANQLNSILHIS